MNTEKTILEILEVPKDKARNYEQMSFKFGSTGKRLHEKRILEKGEDSNGTRYGK